MQGSGETWEGLDIGSREKPTEVVYDWDLVSDEITWGVGLAAAMGIAEWDGLSTGIGYADHLAAASPSSRYEAIMATGGCDTGGGVPYKAVYGLLPTKRSSAPPVWIEDCGRWFADANDRPARAHGVVRVITERYEAERTSAVARRDGADGTFSRAHFFEHVARQLSTAVHRTTPFVVMLISIEPQGGTGAGEAPVDAASLASAVAASRDRLRAEMRKQEILAVHAANTFAVLLEGCTGEHAAAAARRFADVLGQAVPGQALAMQARIGAVLAPMHGRTPQALLQFAEEALEAARQPTSPPYVRYDPEAARPVARAAQDAPDDLLAALNDGRVALALQPIVDAKTRQTLLYEALVRVRRLDGTLMLPDALVPAAERNGVVALIDRRVLDLAFAMLTGDRKLVLSINASVESLHEPCWLDHLRVACKLRPDAARRLTVEITETCAIADLEATRQVLTAIKPLGIKIAIDDFGSGHSSFRNLRQLPIDYLKIDGAFAQNLASSKDDRFFIRTLIDLARNLEIPTVAEWVEDEATAALLTEWGVDYLQGHLFGKAEILDMGKPPQRKAR